MAAISSFLSPNLYHNPRECSGIPKASAWLVAGASPANYRSLSSFSLSSSASCSVRRRRAFSILAVDSTATAEPEAARRLYVGNIPRTVDNEELTKMFAEHGSVEKAEVLWPTFSFVLWLFPLRTWELQLVVGHKASFLEGIWQQLLGILCCWFVFVYLNF